MRVAVGGTASLVELTSLGSLLLDLWCLSLDTFRFLGLWSRRCVFAISPIFTTAPNGVEGFRCYGRAP